MDSVEVRLLGPVEVLRGAERVDVGGPKESALLALLALHAGDEVSTERIVDTLWGERPPRTAAKSLHVRAARLRKALGEGVLVTPGRAYVLAIDAAAVDARRFEQSISEGRGLLERGDHLRAAERLRAALALWRGPALANLAYEPFAQPELRRLEALRIAAVEDRVDADLALGRHAELVPKLEGLVREHPLRERLRAQLMLALYRSGRQADALELYRQTRRELSEELGLDPGPELRELERAILAHDEAIAAPRRGLPRDRQRRLKLVALGGALLVVAATAAAVALLLRDDGEPASLTAIVRNAVGVIDPDGNELAAQVPVGRQPVDVAASGTGVWVANAAHRSITRIDARDRLARETISISDGAYRVAATGGKVWVAGLRSRRASGLEKGATLTFTRVDASSNDIEDTLSTRVSPASIAETATVRIGLAVDQETGVWATDGGSKLLRIDLETHSIVRTYRTPSASAIDVAIVDGAPWVVYGQPSTQSLSAEWSVVRIDPATGIPGAPIALGPDAAAVAAGEGSLWVAGGTSLIRIDPAQNSIVARIPVGNTATAVAVGDDAVWVADAVAAKVTRIDPETNEIDATIRLGNRPTAIAAGEGAVWVTVY